MTDHLNDAHLLLVVALCQTIWAFLLKDNFLRCRNFCLFCTFLCRHDKFSLFRQQILRIMDIQNPLSWTFGRPCRITTAQIEARASYAFPRKSQEKCAHSNKLIDRQSGVISYPGSSSAASRQYCSYAFNNPFLSNTSPQ